MTLTYRELSALIDEMPEDRKDDDVTVLDTQLGQVFPAYDFDVVEALDQQGDVNGVLDDGHYVIKLTSE